MKDDLKDKCKLMNDYRSSDPKMPGLASEIERVIETAHVEAEIDLLCKYINMLSEVFLEDNAEFIRKQCLIAYGEDPFEDQ